MEIVRRAYAALAEEGVEAMLAFTDPQFEMTAPSSLACEPDIYRGHVGLGAGSIPSTMPWRASTWKAKSSRPPPRTGARSCRAFGVGARREGPRGSKTGEVDPP